MKMMGKRVNLSARSVISPDPTLKTDEVGLPIFMAKKLYFPERVNLQNIEFLQQCILNGNEKYPGALYVQKGDFKQFLDQSTLEKRKHISE